MNTNPEASRSHHNTAGGNFLIISCMTVAAWVMLAVLLNESQLNDSLEQFIWAQSFEMGYWKHPPLSTWIVYGCIKLFGQNYLITYGLAAFFFIVTIIASYKIAEILFNADVASITVLIYSLHYGFTRRAQLFNHNTVLIAFIALTVLMVIYALKHQKLWAWSLVGLLAGLSLLTKYQAIVPLMGILMAIIIANNLKRSIAGILVSTGIALIILSPHIFWLINTNFLTFTYAMHYVEDTTFSVRNYRQGAFFVNQIRYLLPFAFFLLLVWTYKFAIKQNDASLKIKLSIEQRSWLAGLIFFPIGVIIFVAFALGVNVQSHWGLQTTQFLPVFLGYWFYKKFNRIDHIQVSSWSLVQIVAISLFVLQGTGVILYERTGLAVRELPAKHITSKAVSYWSSHTHCPLKYLSGHSAMSAMIAAYSGKELLVLEDGDSTKSPWIDREDMIKSGYLEVSVASKSSVSEESISIPISLKTSQSLSDSEDKFIVLKFHSPSIACK